jgi:hypothetical protein
MTTILVINAISSLVAAASIGGLAWRRGRRTAQVQPLYVPSGARRRRGRWALGRIQAQAGATAAPSCAGAAAVLETAVCAAVASLAPADGVWSTAEDAGMTAGLLAGAEAPEEPAGELAVSADTAPALLEPVVEVDGSVPAALVVSVEPADGAELLVSVPELGLAAGADTGADEVGAVEVAVPVGSDAGVAGAAGAPLLGPADAAGVVAVGTLAVGGAEAPAPSAPSAGAATAGGVNPPVAPAVELAGVDVEVPPDVVGVVEAGGDGAPTGVDDTVPVDVPGVASGPAVGPAARGAGRAGIEASSLSRVVGGAAGR